MTSLAVPELPETETIARDLDGALRGAVVRSVTVLRADVLRGARPGRLAAALDGTTLLGVGRRAKSVVLRFAPDAHLVVTPRFTGALLVGVAPVGAYTCLHLDLADGRTLRYDDVRRLGTVALMDPSAFKAWSAALGPEPLDPALTAERFSGLIRGSRRAVKSILMDQRRLAGVGNIYANESLWRSRIRPSRAGARVTHAACAALLGALRDVLSEAIAMRGTTFRDFRDAYGERGGFAAKLEAYGRAGLPCSRCGAALRGTHAIDARQTVWCPSCQR